MARTNDFPRVLWWLTSAWLAGCGRVGFGAADREPPGGLADAPDGTDAPVVVADARPVVDAPDVVDTGIGAPPPPQIAFDVPAMTTVCGAGATDFTAKVSNPGGSNLEIMGVTLMGDGFQVQTTFPMTIAPGGSADIIITTLPAVIGTDIGGTTKTASLVVQANIPADPVPLSTTIMGANISVTNPAPPRIAFSDASGGCPAPRAATIRNAGNVDVMVGLRTPAAFAHAGTSTATIGALGVLTRNFRPIASGACSGAGTVQYEVTGPNCGSSVAISATLGVTFNITGTSSCFCS